MPFPGKWEIIPGITLLLVQSDNNVLQLRRLVLLSLFNLASGIFLHPILAAGCRESKGGSRISFFHACHRHYGLWLGKL